MVKGTFSKLLTVTIACVAAMALFCMSACGNSGGSSSASSNAAQAEYTLLNDGELTIITSPDYPPFENVENGEMVGFEIDLAKAVAEQMGLNPKFVQLQFDAIIPAVTAGGQGDIGMSGFSVDPDRAKEIDFTTTYYIDDQAVAVMKNSGITADNAETDLNQAGIIIAVQTGTTGESYVKENFPNATVQGYGNSTDCFAAMQSGQANAVCTNLAVVKRMIDTAYTDAEIVLEYATGEEYAAVVAQDNPALTEAVNKALKTLEENGTIKELENKWF